MSCAVYSYSLEPEMSRLDPEMSMLPPDSSAFEPDEPAGTWLPVDKCQNR